MTEFGSIGSLKVNVMESPASARPLVPPLTLAVWISVAVGAVLSTVTENPPWVELFATSFAVIVNDFEPAASTALAVSNELRYVYGTPATVYEPAVMDAAVVPVVMFETSAVTLATPVE